MHFLFKPAVPIDKWQKNYFQLHELFRSFAILPSSYIKLNKVSGETTNQKLEMNSSTDWSQGYSGL